MGLENLPPLIIGGATFNTQYNDNPSDMPIAELLLSAFKRGLNAIDTSPYYGPSEILIGEALRKINWHRSKYYICTKVGRIQLDEFDYSPEWVEKSITRSLERLNTEYLDVVFLHDVEFQTEQQAFGALSKLMELKSKGVIKNVGISGYPVEYLYKLSLLCVTHPNVGPLDIIMSYSNMCLQNTTLDSYYDRFIQNSKVKMVNNASILSMSLLNRHETKPFHPGDQSLKDRVAELAHELYTNYDVDLAVLSTRFAIRNWTKANKGKTVLGLSNINELDIAWDQWEKILHESPADVSRDDELVKWCQNFLGDKYGETWKSGISHS